jgi:hypothetical protein
MRILQEWPAVRQSRLTLTEINRFAPFNLSY